MTTDREQLAWGRLLEPPPRKRYEHPRSWQLRSNRRTSFVNRVQRTPGGCWTWTGMRHVHSNGTVYPTVSHRVRGSENRNHKQRSAFVWMVEEFFPELAPGLPSKTSPACGNSLCISPFHRRNSTTTNAKLTPEQVLQVYAAREVGDSTATAAEFNISRNQVLSIWRGRNWASVTGAVRPPPVMRATPPDVEAEIASRRGGGQSSRQVGEELGVSKKTVLRIWTKHRLLEEQGA